MSNVTRILLLIMLGITFLIFIRQIKEKKLSLQYTLSWLFLLLALFIVLLFPGLLSWLTRVCGIALPINMIFFLGFVFTLVIVYRLTAAVSKMSDEIRDLTQKIALMEKEKDDQNKQ